MYKTNIHPYAASLFTCLLSIYSPGSAAQESAFSGMYLNVAVGGTATNVKQAQAIDLDMILDDADFVEAIHIDGANALKTSNAFIGALFLGYGATWDKFYLGAEVFVDIGKYQSYYDTDIVFQGTVAGNVLDNNIAINTQTKLSPFQFGVDVRPGILINSTSLLYARAGVGYGKLEFGSNASVAGVAEGVPEQWFLPLFMSGKRDLAIWRTGAGLEQQLNENWHIRLDYIFSYYGKANLLGTAAFSTPPLIFADAIILNNHTKVKVYNNAIMLGLVYY